MRGEYCIRWLRRRDTKTWYENAILQSYNTSTNTKKGLYTKTRYKDAGSQSTMSASSLSLRTQNQPQYFRITRYLLYQWYYLCINNLRSQWHLNTMAPLAGGNQVCLSLTVFNFLWQVCLNEDGLFGCWGCSTLLSAVVQYFPSGSGPSRYLKLYNSSCINRFSTKIQIQAFSSDWVMLALLAWSTRRLSQCTLTYKHDKNESWVLLQRPNLFALFFLFFI